MSQHRPLPRRACCRARFIATLLVAAWLAAACSDLPNPFTSAPAPPTPTAPAPDLAAPRSRRTRLEAIEFEQISLEQGLSQSAVFCILQDSQGFLWFGTQDGLNRYDGTQFEVYRPRPGDANSLSYHVILSMAQDAQGALWIGTNGGGLNRLERETGRIVRYQHEPGNPHSLSGEYVFAVYADQQGVLWVGTEEGLNRFDPATNRFVRYQHEPQNPHSLSKGGVQSIYQDRSGTLWIGTDGGGLDRFDWETERFAHYGHDPANPHSLSPDAVTSIHEDREGVLWVGTYGGGLNRLERSTGQFTQYRHDPKDPYSLSSDLVRVIYQDRAGVLWIGTHGGGLNRFDPDTGRFLRYQADPTKPGSLSHNFVGAIFEDESGILWIGTLGGGLNHISCASQRFALYRTTPQGAAGVQNGLSDNFVWAIFQDRAGALWIGTYGGGLNRFERDSGSWSHYRHDPGNPTSLSNDTVRAVCQDWQGALWVGTYGGGLNRFEPETGRFVHDRYDARDPTSVSHDVIFALYLDRAGVLWVGTQNGLNRFDQATGRFVRYQVEPGNPRSLSHNAVRAIYEDHLGALWVGTEGGLNRFERETEQFTRYLADPQNPHSLSSEQILSVYEDSAGTLWVGTFGGGLNRFERETETFVHYGEQDGLPSAVVYGILEEDTAPGPAPGHLWLSTNQGLSRFDPRTGTDTPIRTRFVNYDVQDGLQGNEFNAGAYLKSASGEMFFGGVNGFNTFYPAEVEPNPYSPPIVLTSLKQGGQEIELERAVESLQQVTLRWPNNLFEFEFAALDYCQPERNQYAYMLEGFDRDWIYVGKQRFGRYTNLPGKTYTLRIKGTNSDGVWNEQGLALKVTIVPPFWATWWFRGLVALAVVGGAAAGYRLRVRAVEARSRALESQVAQRTAELWQEMEQRAEVERALRQSEAEKAVVEERNRLARELHDSVTQSLYAVTLYGDAAARLLSSGQVEPAAGNLRKLRRTAREALGEMRLLIFELRPPILEQEGLAAALRTRLEAVEGRAGLKTELHVEGEGRLPPHVEEGLYRIAVEALNNALKHAQAHSISVSLRLEPGEVSLEVADDGVGFDLAAAVRSGGFGLEGMLERAQQVGGQLTVDSRPGQGTHVRIALRHRDFVDEYIHIRSE